MPESLSEFLNVEPLNLELLNGSYFGFIHGLSNRL